MFDRFDRKKLMPILLFFGAAFLLLIMLWLLRPEQSDQAILVVTQTPAPRVDRASATPFSVLRTTTPEPARSAGPTELALSRTPFQPTSPDQTVEPTVPSPTATQQPEQAGVTGFFVAVDGRDDGDGSLENPWSLEKAFRHPDELTPGATIWLRGGVYGEGGSTRYTSLLYGQPEQPIIVRQYPGERVTINGGILAKGEWTWFWGFEITNTSEERVANADARPPGLYMLGRGHRAINLVVHNTGHPGIGFWSDVGDGGEIYGCILWGIGTNDTDRGERTRGSAIYAQNQEGIRYIRDVISFRNLSTGMKAYGEEAYVNGFHFEGNISFSNGDRLIFVSGRDHPVEHLVILNNYTYRSPNDPFAPVRLGYHDVDQGDAVIKGNYFVSGANQDGAFWVKRFSSLVFEENVLVSPQMLSTWIRSETDGSIAWDKNRYYGGSFAPFRIDSSSYTFDFWRLLSTFDRSSSYSHEWPKGVEVFVRPNLYEPGRAHVAVYNWDLQDTIEIDLSAVLKPGDAFQIYDVQDYFGAAVVEGIYDGQPVSVPMNLKTVSLILGSNLNIANEHTSPEFGAFVVQRTEQ